MNDVEWHEYSGNGANVSPNISPSTPFTTHHMTMYILIPVDRWPYLMMSTEPYKPATYIQDCPTH